jgi:uncharacterized protein YfaQ (DUF2300 family)
MTQQNPASPDGELVSVPRKAAKVFADIADQYSDREDDHFQVLSDMDVLAPRLLLKHFRDIRAALASAPRPAHEVQAERIDAAVSRCYRRFKDWSKRKFNADDVTWCEVRADLIEIAQAMIATPATGSAPRPDADVNLADELAKIARYFDEKVSNADKHIAGLQPTQQGLINGWKQGKAAWVKNAETIRSASEALQECERLRADAARWNALMQCPRIRMMGSGGIDPNTGERTAGTHVHFEAGFWSDSETNDEQSGPFSTQWGKHALTALADAIIASRALGIAK